MNRKRNVVKVLPKPSEVVTIFRVPDNVGVAELVDALDSGSSGRKPVGVRVPPSTPYEDLCPKLKLNFYRPYYVY